MEFTTGNQSNGLWPENGSMSAFGLRADFPMDLRLRGASARCLWAGNLRNLRTLFQREEAAMRSAFKDALRMLIGVPVRLILLAVLIAAASHPSHSESGNGAHHTLPKR
jgi:hypothetical protein